MNWQWLSEDTLILPHGWAPETGFLRYRWDSYSELMMLYLLGLGSSTYPLPPDSWDAWKRSEFEYDGIKYIGSFAPIFVHQYSQAWFDFRCKRDKYADYFREFRARHRSASALLPRSGETISRLQRGFVGNHRFGFREGLRSLGRPAEDRTDRRHDCSLRLGRIAAVSAAAGDARAARRFRLRYGAGTWSRYGFVDAFNPLINWYDSDVVGIDTGITMVMAENARSAFVWDTFMKNPEAQRGMLRAGFEMYESPNPQEMAPDSAHAARSERGRERANITAIRPKPVPEPAESS